MKSELAKMQCQLRTQAGTNKLGASEQTEMKNEQSKENSAE